MTDPRCDHVREITRRLEAVHGIATRERIPAPEDMLIACILSQHTSDANSERAFANLRTRFPSWIGVANASLDEIADAIRSGGLADTKAARIREVVRLVTAQRGAFDLSHLRETGDDEVRDWLVTLPGVGPKTAAIVLCFALGRPDVPVDTHVFRTSTRLGLIDRRIGEGRAHGVMRQIVPPDLAFRFHMALVRHGRATCRAQRPLCAECSLADLCPSREGEPATRAES
jgi:endonuclease III